MILNRFLKLKKIKGIDDIVLTPGSGICNTIPSVAKPQDLTSTTTLTTTLSTQASNKELSCNFESVCSWSNGATNFNWIVVNGSTAASSFKGPSVDHTLNTEAGLLLTPNVLPSFTTYSTANYYSPFVSGSKCVEFYYYMYGSEVSCNIKLYNNEIDLQILKSIRLENYLCIVKILLHQLEAPNFGLDQSHQSHNGFSHQLIIIQ